MAIEGPLRELGVHDVFQLLDLTRKTGALRIRSALRDNDGVVQFRQGRVVGLVFDGNIHSIGGEYWFDEGRNRTVAVDSRGIREALKSVYQADRILREIDAP